MPDEKPPQSPFALNRTRIFLIVMVAAALALAITSITGSLNTWNQPAPATTEPQ
jgi:hypothetical protein